MREKGRKRKGQKRIKTDERIEKRDERKVKRK